MPKSLEVQVVVLMECTRNPAQFRVKIETKLLLNIQNSGTKIYICMNSCHTYEKIIKIIPFQVDQSQQTLLLKSTRTTKWAGEISFKKLHREENEMISRRLYCLQLTDQERATTGHCHHLKSKQPIYIFYLHIEILFSNYIACAVNRRDPFYHVLKVTSV